MSHEYDILVVKDFSRFSRRNSYGLVELETLRDNGIRIISIGDSIDFPVQDDWMLIQFKFLMNEMPVTDTSKKIKAIIDNRQKNGKWICAVPYGYRITNTKAMTYEIDPPAAAVVREIFRLYNIGWGYKRIANNLTDNGCPTPRANEIAYKEANGGTTNLKAKTAWSIITVSEILSNDFYIGTLRQKKFTRAKINGKDKNVAEEEQIVIENAHSPIVDTMTYALAQELRQQRSRDNYRGNKKYDNDYSGFLRCGDCGAPMFSMSRPDLAPAYTCGTYHRRGRVGCTSHHIRVDKLDELIKRYIRKIMDNSDFMIEQLKDAIKQQPDNEAKIGNTLDTLERQLEDSRQQLKTLLKRKILDTMNAEPEQADILSETYGEMEQELISRIKGLEKQVDQNIDSRNRLIEINRATRTVIDVFESILVKPKLCKADISLIIDHILVYENHLDVHLKADIDSLLQTGSSDTQKEDTSENFTGDIKNISKFDQIVQPEGKGKYKVLDVNVVSEGDPLEIYTEKDGEVIFKKYSPMGEWSESANQICETLFKTAGCCAAVADRDTYISVCGIPKRELADKHISSDLEQLMEARRLYQRKSGEKGPPVIDNSDKYIIETAAPIISEGDVMGCVVFFSEGDKILGEVEYKLAQTVAGFLGKQMES